MQLKRIYYFSISLILGCSYDIHNHLCSTYRGLWFELSGRTLAAQALGLNLVNCKLLHFPLFSLVTTKALAIKPHWFTTSCRASPKKSVVASFHPDIMQKLLEADIMLHHGMGLAEQHTLWFYTLLWQANHAQQQGLSLSAVTWTHASTVHCDKSTYEWAARVRVCNPGPLVQPFPSEINYFNSTPYNLKPVRIHHQC